MRIDTIKIENFRLFKEQEFNFHPQFNLIIGENGSGKTSLLEALAVALGGWAHTFIKDKHNLRPIENDDIREIQLDNRFDKTKRTSIKAIGQAKIVDNYKKVESINAEWIRYREEGDNNTYTFGSYIYPSSSELIRYNFNPETIIFNIFNYIEQGSTFSFPLIAFYPCNRLWKPKNKLNIESSATAKYSRFAPYKDCFDVGINHQDIAEWLLKNELDFLQKGKESTDLQAFRNAAKFALEGCTGIKFDMAQSRIIVDFENKPSIPFEHLSDGQRTILGLFCDLARRASIPNPNALNMRLGGSVNSMVTGIVLIDELDLHLHPKWQRNIIENLRKAFPNIQFICTTHSPFLIQSLRQGKLIKLDDNETPDEYYDLSLEDIVETIQEVELPQKSQRYNEMLKTAEAYYKKLHECDDESDEVLLKLRAELDDLTIPFSDDPAFMAQLKFERDTVLANKGIK